MGNSQKKIHQAKQKHEAICVWDANAVKNKLDDTFRHFLIKKHDLIEFYAIFNIRLVLSLITVSFAGVALAYDKLHPYPQSRQMLIYTVFGYFAAMTVLTLFLLFIENGCFMQARMFRPGSIAHQQKLTFRSSMKKYDPCYRLSVRDNSGNEIVGRTLPVEKFFTQQGAIVKKPVDEALSNVVAELEAAFKKHE